MELKKLAGEAEKVVREAGDLVCSLQHPKVYTKEGHANFVTEADLAAQDYLVEKLTYLLPEAHFFAEEQEKNALRPGYNWIIDPIDGTTNFMRGYRPCSISVGLVRDGEGVLGLVYDIWAGEMFSAMKGEGAFCQGEPIRAAEVPMENALIAFGTSPYYRELAEPTFGAIRELFLRCGDLRRSGSAALDLCHVAAGRCDGFFESILSPWDYCAATVILREAGALSGTLGGGALGYEKPMLVMAGSPAVFQELREVVERHLGRPAEE
ncbi:inositol monophosphatase [Acutalibacter sp. 1XD8-33]|uniref:inositol monophosphatase family protein n=1 Tax=Acutalibacter sp. 1XD8-33 TaxID=2320081 RepID=UPI000EA1E1DC|nr:inositol monophosphatase family protein [Acutalibacter sp. 1XD8-33]RKJ40741.1 inositol monophosphatase [Acutalibacter sp. 1XD8-33]